MLCPSRRGRGKTEKRKQGVSCSMVVEDFDLPGFTCTKSGEDYDLPERHSKVVKIHCTSNISDEAALMNASHNF